MARRVHIICCFLCLLSGMWAVAADPLLPNSLDPKADGHTVYQTLCFQCHGAQGQGNEALKAPSIAGRPAWYVQQQLLNFQQGRRGAHPEDLTGVLMAAMAKLLQPAQVVGVAAAVEKMAVVPPIASAALKNPNLEEGRLLFTERCMECHRYNGSGEMTFGSPPLTGLPDWYLLAQIDKYKNGWRGVHPQDPNGAKMIVSAQFIETEQARHDVVAFILSLNPLPVETNKNRNHRDEPFGSPSTATDRRSTSALR